MSADPALSVETDDAHQPAPVPAPRAETGLPDRPAAPPSLRQRLEGWAESLDLTLPRLAAGAAVLAALGIVGWRLLGTPSAPPEMTLPLTSTPDQGPSPGASGAGPATTEPPGESGAGASVDGNGSAGASEESRSPLVVHVAGAVWEPGVQRLDPAARVIDAVEAAGGATGDADLARVNLAAPLEDGQQVYLPRVGEDLPELAPTPGEPAITNNAGNGSSESGSPHDIVNINTAGTAELETLHGIGPALAQAIADHRDEHGPFGSVEQLTDVRGIGQAKLDGLRDQVTV